MNFRSVTLCAASALFALACAHNPEPDPEPELVPDQPMRVAPPLGAVKPGDCVEAVRRAVEKPDIAVDRLASPKVMNPPALPPKTMPVAVRRAKYSEVRVSVMVDTLGKADMKTWTVIKTTHPWLESSFRAAVPKWTFEPAMLAGCKVPRVWLGGFTAGTPPKG
ncbi:MAG: hypothetical protein JWM95_2505 [Gemmatimonadetes bacterium]|nr:hypothetical protein [Gemmatimonadota bacterium]